jgi:Uma2 family endonuclease
MRRAGRDPAGGGRTAVAGDGHAVAGHDLKGGAWETLPADGNRYEVIDGVLYMTTAPSSVHQWIVQQIFLMLFQQIDPKGLSTTLWAPIGLFMPGCDPVQPDLLVVRAEDRHIFRETRIRGIPALIADVVSPSHATYDTRIKRRAYAHAGVPECEHRLLLPVG